MNSGRDPSRYSSHSFRRGGATWAFGCEVSPELIQIHGDWKSEAYKRYLDFDFEDWGRVVKLMLDKIKKL